MSSPGTDKRSADRRARDEQIVTEPLLAPFDLPADGVSLPVEGRLPQHRRPLAVVGVVENGLVRPVDPAVALQEHARVIIVASEGL